jgi:hypothetical protein
LSAFFEGFGLAVTGGGEGTAAEAATGLTANAATSARRRARRGVRRTGVAPCRLRASTLRGATSA